MKTIFPLLLLFSLITASCHKSDSDDTETSASSDTGEYILFTLNGDSFNNEKFALTELPKQSACNFNSPKNDFSLSAPANGGYVDGHFAFYLKKTGTVPLDTIQNTSYFMFSSNKGDYIMVCTEGKLTITQYPNRVSAYVKGSFSGTYLDVQSKQTFTITGGNFRIQRTL